LAWKIKISKKADRSLRKLDKCMQKEIINYLNVRVLGSVHPKKFGESLVGDKSGLWRYRVRDYRIICKIEDDTLLVLVIDIGHRKEIYEKKI